MNKPNDLTGMIFGRLTILEMTPERKHKCVVWKCKCICGNIKYVQSTLLVSKGVQSCGCLPKERMRAIGKQYGAINGSNYEGKPLGIAARNEVYRNYKQHAKTRNLVFDLDMQIFERLTSLNCHYCNIEPYQYGGKHARMYNGVYVYNGIDRMDSSIGYIESNCVSCCGTCNRAKLAMGYDEFRLWIERVYNHFLRKDVI